MKKATKPPAEKVRADSLAQSAAFIAKAEELEADGDESAAVKIMGRMAQMKPAPRPSKSKDE
ncbi:MAG: hypothetical protein IOC82_01495 [Aestuariivirga sp.]|nr:hypothetical protein [Aestuariivirga sp.]